MMRFKVLSSLKVGLCYLSFFLGASTASFANTEFQIPSISNSLQFPYLVVIENSGQSKLAPGIYRRDKGGQNIPIILGRVNQTQNRLGFIQQLKTSETTEMNESFVMVDSKLYLIDSHSQLDKPESIIEIGSDRLPIYEVGTKRRIFLPQQLDDEFIQIFSHANEGVENVLISTRARSIFGHGENQGLTFYLPIKLSAIDTVFKTLSSATLIDYKYRSKKILSILVTKKPILSEILLEEFIRFLKTVPETRTPLKIISETQSMLDYLNGVGNPQFDVSNDTLASWPVVKDNLEAAPGAPLVVQLILGQGSNMSLSNKHNVLAKKTQFGFEFGEVRRQLDIPIDRITDGFKSVERRAQESFKIINAKGSWVSYLFFSENNLRIAALAPSNKEILISESLLKVPFDPNETLKAISYYLHYDTKTSDAYLFLSTRFEKEELKLIHLKQLTPGSLFVSHTVNLGEVYLSSEEIAEKVINGEDNGIYFKGAKYVDKKNQFAETAMIDVAKTAASDRVRYAFNVPKKVTAIGPHYNHIEFEDSWVEKDDRKTGFYRSAGSAVQVDGGRFVELPGSVPTALKFTGNFFENGEPVEVHIAGGRMDAEGAKIASRPEFIKIFVSTSEGSKTPYMTDLRIDAAYPLSTLESLIAIPHVHKSLRIGFAAVFKTEGNKRFIQYVLMERIVENSKFKTEIVHRSERDLKNPGKEFYIQNQVVYGRSGRPFFINPDEQIPGARANYTSLDDVPFHPSFYEDLKSPILFDSMATNMGSFGHGQSRQFHWIHHSSNSLVSTLMYLENEFFKSRGDVSGKASEKDANDREKNRLSAELYQARFEEFNLLVPQLMETIKSQRRTILLVNEKEKSILYQILAHYYSRAKDTNQATGVLTSENATQNEFESNFAELRRLNSSGSYSPLITDASVLIKIDRPKVDDQGAIYAKLGGSSENLAHAVDIFLNEGRIEPMTEAEKPLVPLVIISTYDEYEKLTEIAPHFNFSKKFEFNQEIVSSNAAVIPPQKPGSTDIIRGFAKTKISRAEENLFPEVMDTARDLANLKNAPKLNVLLAEKDISEMIYRTLLKKWASDSHSSDEIWSHKNSNLTLHDFSLSNSDLTSEGPKQKRFAKLLFLSKGSKQKRSVILMPLSLLSNLERFSNDEQSKILVFLKDTLKSIGIGGGESENERAHALYLIRSGGTAVPPDQIKNYDLPYSVLLIGTKEEWSGIVEATKFEQRFGLIHQFPTKDIRAPQRPAQIEFLSKIFENEDFRKSEIRFVLEREHPRADQSAEKEAFLKYLIARSEVLADSLKQNRLQTFLRLYQELQRSISEDIQLRETKVLDRNFAERLFTRIFSIPMNLHILPADDYLNVLNQRDILFRLQRAGYLSSVDVKQRVIRTILSQTQEDSSLNIQSSIIIFGESGTGKTFLFDTLVELLGLKLYNFKDPFKNNEAMAFKFNLGQIVESGSESGSLMTAEGLIEHMNEFIGSQNGNRGFLLLDDAHKCKAKSLEKILAFVNTLTDARGGIVTVTRKSKGDTREVSIRNLNLMMTLNPESDADKLKKYVKDPKNLDEQIIASLSTQEKSIESSFLMRWKTKIRLDEFPLDAKESKLAEILKKSSQSLFSAQGKLLFYSPDTVVDIAKIYKNLDARSFASQAPAAILDIKPANDSSRLLITSPRNMFEVEGGSSVDKIETHDGKDTDSKTVVRRHIQTSFADQGFIGKLRLLELMADSFRSITLEGFANAASSDKTVNANALAKSSFGPAIFHGITNHILRQKRLPTDSFNLSAANFDAKGARVREGFYKELKQHKITGATPALPIQFFEDLVDGDELKDFLHPGLSSKNIETRKKVLIEFSNRLVEPLDKLLRDLLQLENFDIYPEPAQWILGLKKVDHRKAVAARSDEIFKIYLEFVDRIINPHLRENQNQKEFAAASAFVVSRAFFVAIDQAITQLRWDSVIKFIPNAFSVAAHNIELGQHVEFLDFLFQNYHSLFVPRSHDMVFQIAEGSELYGLWKDKSKVESENLNFERFCRDLLVGAKP